MIDQGSDQQIERGRAFFNQRRPSTGKTAKPVFQYVFDVTKQLIPKGEGGQTAIDLGCHWGRYTTVLAETYGRVIGVDFAEDALQTAEARPNISYVRLDLNKQADALRNYQPVDCFLAIAIFEMLQSPGEIMQSMYQAGAGDCRAFVLVPNRRSLNYVSLRVALWAMRLLRGKDRYIYNNHLTQGRLVEYAEVAGFVIESSGAIVGVPVYMTSVLPDFLQRLLLSMDTIFLNVLGGSYHWILCRKPKAHEPAAQAELGDTCKSF